MLRSRAFALLLCPSLLVACGDTDANDGGGGGGGTGGTGGAGSTTSTSSSPSGTGGGPVCTGDAATWDAIEKTDIPCQSASDCCVVVNGCLAEAVLVASSDFESAQDAWPTCLEQCVDCVVPYVAVVCEAGLCAAYADDVDLAPPATSHCGGATETAGPNGPGQAFDCTGAPM